jgi:hypothetical protein
MLRTARLAAAESTSDGSRRDIAVVIVMFVSGIYSRSGTKNRHEPARPTVAEANNRCIKST